MDQVLDYFQNHSTDWLLLIRDHALLSLLSLALAMLVGLPAGLLCARVRRAQGPVMALFQVLRIVPSLAVLLLLIPVMGTGMRPAVAALTILAIPPILMNTMTGLSQVPSFMIETAAGCGMTSGQVWRKVKIPLALPMILTGIKTAFIEIIASATLAAKIGAGGLGEIIFTGLGLYRMDLLVIGGLTVALLSTFAGLSLDALDHFALRYQHV